MRIPHADVLPPRLLPIAVRAYTEPTAAKKRSLTKGAVHDWPKLVLLFDTETTTDETQRLRFGAFRVCVWKNSDRRSKVRELALVCVAEGLFYADDLPETDRKGFEILRAYAENKASDTASGHGRDLQFLSRTEFVERYIWRIGFLAKALIAGFNLPFDLSRLAVHAGPTRGRRMAGGFSLTLFERLKAREKRTDNGFRPRVLIKHLDSKRSLMEFSSCRGQPRFRGHFLDLRTAAFGLTDERHTLASACAAFGIPDGKGQIASFEAITPEFIGYCRKDVQASQRLLAKIRVEFDKHPVKLSATRLYSPASMVKGYLRALGITPPLSRVQGISKHDLGIAMSAYFGGRAECHIRHQSVPVVLTDATSMYPTVNILAKLWEYATAKTLRRRDVTEYARHILESVCLDRCLAQDFWPQVRFFALVKPAADLLPVRGKYVPGSDAWTIGLNYLSSEEGIWRCGFDLAGSVLLTGKVPHIISAFAIEPEGYAEDMQPLHFRGQIPIDPRMDFFRTLIEERHRTRKDCALDAEERKRLVQTLKVNANAGAYGITAQFNPVQLPKGVQESVMVYGGGEPYDCQVHQVEEPGEFCFPPIAALITGAARLMLAIVERCVTDQGGTYLSTDTDSMAIVASESGGLVPCRDGPLLMSNGVPAIRALTWKQVEHIVTTLESLKPYSGVVTDPLLKIESENFVEGKQRQLYGIMISAKRYAVYERTETSGLQIVKFSEHGLGHLLAPTDPASRTSEQRDWIKEIWHRIACLAEGVDPGPEPAWFDAPAIARLSFSTPDLLAPYAKSQKKYSYANQVKPFNFLVTATIAKLGVPAGLDPERCRVIAPFNQYSKDWTQLEWRDLYSGKRVRISTESIRQPGTVTAKTFRDVFADFVRHPESKSIGSVGLLQRRHVTPSKIVHIGKESNKLDETDAGLPAEWRDVQLVYTPPDLDPWIEEILPFLEQWPVAEVAEGAGISVRTVYRIRRQKRRPSPRACNALGRYVRSRLAAEVGFNQPD